MAMKFFKLGCYLAFFTAALHMVGAHIVPALSPPVPDNDTERQMLDLMSNYRFALPGVAGRSMQEMLGGFSLLMALHLALSGGIGLIIARRGVGDALLIKAAARTFAAAYAVAVVISLMHFFLIPTITFGSIALAFAIAGFARNRNNS
jgi:hypothetical protein